MLDSGPMDLLSGAVGLYREAFLEMPTVAFGALVFLVAGMVGSFLNVCIWRIPRGQSIVTPRSRCVSCRHVLTLPDLIPVLSWLVQGGKCRHCRAPVSLRYQVVELVNISLWMACWARFGRTWAMLQASAMASSVVGVLGVAWMTRKLRREGGQPEAPAGYDVLAGPGAAPEGRRAGFSFVEILMTVTVLAVIVGPFLMTIQQAYLGSGKNREYIQAFNLCREKLEELRVVPPERLKSDWDVYVAGDLNIFQDEFFGPYAKMKQNPEAFYAAFSDVHSEDHQLTESVMARFRRVFKTYHGFDYQLYPGDYGSRFRRYTKVEDLTDKAHPNNVLKKITVTVVIDSKSTRGRELKLMAYATNR